MKPQAAPPDPDDVDVVATGSRDLHVGFLRVVERRLRHRLFDGSMSPEIVREVAVHRNASCVLPYDPRTDRVLLIRQFLAGAHVAGVPARPLQVVAGMVDEGEKPGEAAVREAREEAGIDLGKVHHAVTFMPSPGGSSERVFCFFSVADLSSAGGTHGLAQEGEDIRVETMQADRAIALLDAGLIEAGPAVVLLTWFARRRAEGRLPFAGPNEG